jgi:hypothetical protein
MPGPSKFTAANCKKVIEALSYGASHETAALHAGISGATLSRWLDRGRAGEPESRYAKFLEACQQAEAMPKMRALRIVHRDMDENPQLAKWFLERREQGFAPPQPVGPPAMTGPVLIQLSLHEGASPATEVEVIDVADVSALPAPSTPA